MERLPSGWKASRSPIVDHLYSLVLDVSGRKDRFRRFNLVYGAELQIARTLDLEEALARFESDLHLYAAALSRRKIFVHAGVVGWKNQAIVIPGLSHSGKTSLTVALLKAGAEFYSDEYAVLDSRGMVHPFPRPLGIRDAVGLRQGRVPYQSLGARAGKRPLPVGLVVLTKYEKGAKWRPRPLSHGRSMLGLLGNAVAAQLNTEAALATLEIVAEAATTIKGIRGDAESVAAQILALSEQVNPASRKINGSSII
jgi:hypothetical protein